MNWTATEIARAVCRQTLQRKCIVLVDNCYWTGYEADLLGVTMDRRLIDVEVKISRADLKADAGKDKWWHRFVSGYEEVPYPAAHGGSYRHAVHSKTAREWPVKVWKHYYALPADIWKPELVAALPSPHSGVLLFSRSHQTGNAIMRCERRSTPCKDAMRLTEAQALDVARLANLRMWDAYDAMDRMRADAEARRRLSS